jgi:hypothetical protein
MSISDGWLWFAHLAMAFGDMENGHVNRIYAAFSSGSFRTKQYTMFVPLSRLALGHRAMLF